eukprot:4951135-Pyramimonas_sp.AAC.1
MHKFQINSPSPPASQRTTPYSSLDNTTPSQLRSTPAGPAVFDAGGSVSRLARENQPMPTPPSYICMPCQPMPTPPSYMPKREVQPGETGDMHAGLPGLDCPKSTIVL